MSSNAAGGAPETGGTPGTDGSTPACSLIVGNFAETDTVAQTDCSPAPTGGSSDITVAVDGAQVTVTIGTVGTCIGTAKGCTVSCTATDPSTGEMLSADLSFEASGFSGQITVMESGCSVVLNATGVRQ